MERTLIIALIALILQVFVLRFALSIRERMRMQAAQLKLQILMARQAGVQQKDIDSALQELPA